MQESGTGDILSNVCATLTAQLFINIFCDSYNRRYGSYDRARRHAGLLVLSHIARARCHHWMALFNLLQFLKNYISFTNQKHSPISPEVYCYLLSILVVWISLISSFKEDLIIRQSWIPNFASIITVMALVVLDILVPLYHSIRTHVMPPLRPAYDSYIVFIIYIFLPVSGNVHAAILGIATTICYLILMAVMTYRLDEHIIVKVCRCPVSGWASTWALTFFGGFWLSLLSFLDLHRFCLFTLRQFLRYLFSLIAWSGHSPGISWSSRMRWR